MARPPTYTSDAEKPVTVSVRIPKALYAEAKHHVAQRRMSLTELLLDGLRLALSTPTDPRNILVSQDNTVIQELQEMVNTAVQVALIEARRSGTLAPKVSAEPVAEALADAAAFLEDADDEGMPASEAAGEPAPKLSYNSNTVIQEKAPKRHGRPSGSMRQRILDLLYDHQEGLSTEQLRAFLKPEKPIGDTLQGMRRQGVVRTEGSGKAMRYFVG